MRWSELDLDETTAYPSFSHLLSTWIAVAVGVGGPRASVALGPLFAFTAWWAIGIIALLDAGLLAALAAIALVSSFLPEHWFARFLMPGILTQALVWGGVAAARLAERQAAEMDEVSDAAKRAAGILAGAASSAEQAVTITVRPAVTNFGGSARLQVLVARDEKNRSLVWEVDGPGYYRSSGMDLDGASAPRSFLFVMRNLPGGEFEVRATVRRSDNSTVVDRSIIRVVGGPGN